MPTTSEFPAPQCFCANKLTAIVPQAPEGPWAATSKENDETYRPSQGLAYVCNNLRIMDDPWKK